MKLGLGREQQMTNTKNQLICPNAQPHPKNRQQIETMPLEYLTQSSRNSTLSAEPTLAEVGRSLSPSDTGWQRPSMTLVRAARLRSRALSPLSLERELQPRLLRRRLLPRRGKPIGWGWSVHETLVFYLRFSGKEQQQ